MQREDTHRFADFNRPRVARDGAALEAISLVEDLLDMLPTLDLSARDYSQLVNTYARRLREHTNQLEQQLLHDWGRA